MVLGSEASSAIVARSASKLFLDGAIIAFRQLTLAVKPKETLCIVGPSGYGKTTLLRCIAGQFFREQGVQSRPTHVHGIDIVTDKPHVFAERTEADEIDKVLKPGMVIMAEPNPITADGMFGIFLGHTFIVTDDGHECVDGFPLDLAIV